MRRERDADKAALRALYGANRAWELAMLAWPDAAKQRFLDDQFRLQCAHFAAHHAGADFLVLTRAGPPRGEGLIGRLYLDRRGEMWQLLEIGLIPSEQRQGLGTAIIDSLKRAAVDAGAAGLSLHVAIDNVRATTLYRRLGFAECDTASETHRRMEWRHRPS